MNEKHQKILQTIGTPYYDEIELFERLTSTKARRTMMKVVAKGSNSVPMEKLTSIMKVSGVEADRIYTDFEFAKLININGNEIQILKAEGQLQVAINNFNPEN